MVNRYDPREEAAKSVGKKQVGGTHYQTHSIQPWDIIDMYGLDYHRGNAIKYILRNKMDMYEDIEKAVHYLEHWLEINKHLKNDTMPTIQERQEHFNATGLFASDSDILYWLRNTEER